MKKRILALLTAGIMLASFAGCGDNSENGSSTAGGDNASGGASAGIKVMIDGSTSVGPVMELIAKDYEGKNSGSKIDVQQTDSSSGLQAAMNGSADIAMASRELKQAEKDGGLVPTTIAIDGIAIVVNPKNGVKELTKDQVTKIFSGEIKNWKEVGGADEEIIVITREDGSGTRSAFEELLKVDTEVLGETAQVTADSNGAVKQNVVSKTGGIGYLSLGIVDKDVTALKIDGVEATADNVKNGSYTISRPFLVATKGEAKGDAKTFIDFVLSADGQDIVESKGYIRVK